MNHVFGASFLKNPETVNSPVLGPVFPRQVDASDILAQAGLLFAEHKAGNESQASNEIEQETSTKMYTETLKSEILARDSIAADQSVLLHLSSLDPDISNELEISMPELMLGFFNVDPDSCRDLQVGGKPLSLYTTASNEPQTEISDSPKAEVLEIETLPGEESEASRWPKSPKKVDQWTWILPVGSIASARSFARTWDGKTLSLSDSTKVVVRAEQLLH
jgi:hypothetical protein